jgi:pimeloyl-ACP methyl ester carboxylesterase
MAAGKRPSLPIARHAPAFGGWLLGRLATPARRAPGLFLRLAAGEMPAVDRRALARPDVRAAFLANHQRAFRRGSRGVGQDLRLLTRPRGFDLESIRVPTSIHQGDADTTVPLQHARRFAEAIPGADLHIHPGQGHFSILSTPEQTLATLAAQLVEVPQDGTEEGRGAHGVAVDAVRRGDSARAEILWHARSCGRHIAQFGLRRSKR